MKKALPYILIFAVLFIAGGIYIDRTSTKPLLQSKLFGSTSDKTASMSDINFKDLGQAPEFTGIFGWLNSDPLTMQQLRGKVVLIDFWTYSCINCIRTLPYVTRWYDTYKDRGFVVIGVHTPEFAFEKVTNNVADAIRRFKINYPVAQDNDFRTWNAYDNIYWPAEYLIDQNGRIVYTHFGEGKYDVTENAIRKLLGMEDGVATDAGQLNGRVKSPEMYFGTQRLEFLAEPQKPYTSETNYTFPAGLQTNTFALEGQWRFDGEKTVLTSGPGKIKLKFNAGKVHMVANATNPDKRTFVEVRVDGKIIQTMGIDASQLYTLFDSNEYREHELELYIDTAGFEIFTFTFG